MMMLAIALAMAAPATSPGFTELSPARIIKQLNAFRAASGFPSRVKLQSTWARGCRLHDHYMFLNNMLGHTETPGSPGYTSAGNFAGTHSVLTNGTSWVDGNPWLNAPIHLNQTLAPLIVRAGGSETDGFNCLTTFLGESRASAPRTPRILTYPRSGGTMPYQQVALETHPIPQEKVGIPAGTPTGPYLMVYYYGQPGGGGKYPSLASATMTGPHGRIAVKTIGTRDHYSDLSMTWGSGFIIPASPLTPNTRYTVRATVKADSQGGGSFHRTVRFRFRTTDKKLCGNGSQGWFTPESCGDMPVSSE